jgi:hypothetical protein
VRRIAVVALQVGLLASAPVGGGAQVVQCRSFVSRNPVIVIGAYVETAQQPVAPRLDSLSGWIEDCYAFEGRLVAEVVLRDETVSIRSQDTLVVRWIGNCWTKLPRVFRGLDASGDSVFSAALAARDCHGPAPGGIQLVVGLQPVDDGFAPGPGGFNLPIDWLPAVLCEISGCDDPE